MKQVITLHILNMYVPVILNKVGKNSPKKKNNGKKNVDGYMSPSMGIDLWSEKCYASVKKEKKKL